MDQMMPIFAVWGAILATVTFGWNIWRWRSENTLIVVKTGLYEWPMEEGIQLEIRNLGGKKTVIEELRLTKFWNGFYGYLGLCEHQEYASNKYRETVVLPFALEPNCSWKGRIPFEEDSANALKKRLLLTKHRLYCQIFCSHRLKPITVRVSPDDFDM